MWRQSQSAVEPIAIDMKSSKKYVYVRKNIRTFIRDDGQLVYIYDECKIPKEVYDIFKGQADNESRISDIEEVITDIIGGGY